MPHNQWLKDCALFLCAVLMLSCGTVRATRSMFGGTLPFDVEIDPDANASSAIAVDVVVLYDATLLEQLLKLRAADWFAQKEQFQKDHPSQILVRGWEWVPSQPVGRVEVPYSAGARKVVLFADYSSEGTHRQTLEPQQLFKLKLARDDFEVTQ